MRVLLLTVGKPRDRELAALHDRYAGRIARLGVEYRQAAVPEVRPTGRFTEEHIRQREARALLERLGPDDRLVALDPGGTSWTSPQLAQRLPRWAQTRAVLVVGGPSGLHDELLARAVARWSLSRLTLPHELVRVVVAEQVYRALTILRGLPYHK